MAKHGLLHRRMGCKVLLLGPEPHTQLGKGPGQCLVHRNQSRRHLPKSALCYLTLWDQGWDMSVVPLQSAEL